MKKTLLLTASILLLGTQIALGVSIEPIILTLSSQAPATIESAALALQTSVANIKSLQTIHESEIQRVFYFESDKSYSTDFYVKSYSAVLINGDCVRASFWPAGGIYSCDRWMSDRAVEIPLTEDAYHQLQKIYEAQK